MGDTDTDTDAFAGAWEQDRTYLLNIAYRLVGSFSEAEDLVQEAFTRLLRTDNAHIHDVRGWLVVVVSRLCLDHLRSARTRHEFDGMPWFPEPLVGREDSVDLADMVTLDESVRMALLIVLEQLSPAERVVFILHDVFDFSFEEIAPMVDRTAAACRQLASRARRRVKAEAAPRLAVDPAEIRRVAERFLSACAGGELPPLLEVLDPAVVGWVDLGGGLATMHQPSSGSRQVAEQTLAFFGPESGSRLQVVNVNGETGIIAARDGRPFAVLVLTVRDERVTVVYSIADGKKLGRIRMEDLT